MKILVSFFWERTIEEMICKLFLYFRSMPSTCEIPLCDDDYDDDDEEN
jgi:hypothetical protein